MGLSKNTKTALTESCQIYQISIAKAAAKKLKIFSESVPQMYPKAVLISEAPKKKMLFIDQRSRKTLLAVGMVTTSNNKTTKTIQKAAAKRFSYF